MLVVPKAGRAAIKTQLLCEKGPSGGAKKMLGQFRGEDDQTNPDSLSGCGAMQLVEVLGHAFKVDSVFSRFSVFIEFQSIAEEVRKFSGKRNGMAFSIEEGNHEIHGEPVLVSNVGPKPSALPRSGLPIDETQFRMSLRELGVSPKNGPVDPAMYVSAAQDRAHPSIGAKISSPGRKGPSRFQMPFFRAAVTKTFGRHPGVRDR